MTGCEAQLLQLLHCHGQGNVVSLKACRRAAVGAMAELGALQSPPCVMGTFPPYALHLHGTEVFLAAFQATRPDRDRLKSFPSLHLMRMI